MKRLLLDTHVFLWWRQAHPRIGPEAVAVIGGAEEVYVSVASSWEAAIKASLGRLEIPRPFADEVASSRFLELPVRFTHTAELGILPHHHKDPFDRLLVAQARAESLVLVTHEDALSCYEVALLRV